MGAIDHSVKSYLKIPEIFAQLFNECFFDREHYIRTEDLTEQDSVMTMAELPGKRNGKERKAQERTRDVCMQSVSGMGYRIILGVEEQTDIHYYMPVRVMQMDAMNYEKQCRQKAAKAREQTGRLSPAEGMPKETRICPVMTIVLYIGEKEWDGPRELYDLFDVPPGEKEWLAKYVANYPMHLIDARHMSREELDRFTGDLKIFFTLLREKYDEETIKMVIAKYPDTWYTLAVVKDDERYRECAQAKESNIQAKKGEGHMDPNLDRIENKGFQRGISQGLSQGLNQGISLINELCRKLMADGRDSDWRRSVDDEVYQRQLLKEYGLVKN